MKMTQEEFDARVDLLISEEMADARGMWSWFYISYADEDGFRGGLYLRAYGPVSALARAATEKLNPGGEARVIGPLPEDNPEAPLPPHHLRERLLSLEQLKSFAPMVQWHDGKDV